MIQAQSIDDGSIVGLLRSGQQESNITINKSSKIIGTTNSLDTHGIYHPVSELCGVLNIYCSSTSDLVVFEDVCFTADESPVLCYNGNIIFRRCRFKSTLNSGVKVLRGESPTSQCCIRELCC